ncbi:hypothetical protein KXD40_002290 [Peronospora effusa]|nr:hypothetical protein KXD40_002290 [Peronospora effusa]
MDAQRALLDSLMGLNRDGDRPNEAILDFNHPKVCKLYLCGLCPRELFQHTRLDSGACELLHVPALRSAFEQEEDVERDFEYERQLVNELSKFLVDVEKKITRAQKRLEEDGDDNQDRTQVLQFTQDIQDATIKAEQAAQNGDVDKSLQLMEQVELFKRKRREVLRQSTANSNASSVAMMVDNVNQKLRVCDVCGAFLSIFDSDRRLADHFGGKVHMGYVQIRKKLKELMEKIKVDKKEDTLKRRHPVDRNVRAGGEKANQNVVALMIENDGEIEIGRGVESADVIVIEVTVVVIADDDQRAPAEVLSKSGVGGIATRIENVLLGVLVAFAYQIRNNHWY